MPTIETEARSQRTPGVIPTLAAAATAALLAWASPSAASGGAKFVVETNSYLLGQAMDLLDQRHVVWHDPIVRDEDGDGETHIYRSTLSGAGKVCLTCGLPGPAVFTNWSGLLGAPRPLGPHPPQLAAKKRAR